MGLFLKVSTAVTVKIGPFVDETDGKTAETGLTLTQGDIRLSKNGGNMAQKNEASACSHDEIGYYDCNIDTTDTNTLGRLQLMVHESGALPVYHEYMVVTANFYDSICSTDTLQADLTQMGGVAQSATDLKDFADTGYDPTTHKVQGVVLCDTTTTNTDMITSATVNAACDDALNTAIPGAPTAGSINDVVKDVDGKLPTNNFMGSSVKTDKDDEIDAIKAKTDLIGASVALEGGGNLAAVKTQTDKLNFTGTDVKATLDGEEVTPTAASKTGYALSAAGIDGILDETVDTNAPANANSLRETVNVIASAVAGKCSGNELGTPTFRDLGDTKNRITSTVDGNKNRTAVTQDGT